MTNHYTIAADENGEPFVLEKQLRIRGYWSDKLIKIIEEEGWDEARKRVCSYCHCYRPTQEEKESDEEIDARVCYEDDKCGPTESVRVPI